MYCLLMCTEISTHTFFMMWLTCSFEYHFLTTSGSCSAFCNAETKAVQKVRKRGSAAETKAVQKVRKRDSAAETKRSEAEKERLSS